MAEVKLASFSKYCTTIVRRRAWDRLASTISAYDSELNGRAEAGDLSETALKSIQKTLAQAHTGIKDGNLEQGWKCLLAAQRVEILNLKGPALTATAAAIRNEAEKLNAWRKAAVLAILGSDDASAQGKALTSEGVFRAALLRDEHYNNEAYKDALRRGSALRLALLLIAVLVTLLWLSYSGNLAILSSLESYPIRGHFLLSVGIVGLLGAIVSAITDVPKANSSARIPEIASSFRVMMLRLFMGPASAIVICFAVQSDFSNSILHLEKVDGYAILVVAFVAGFTERLVLRVVEGIAGKS